MRKYKTAAISVRLPEDFKDLLSSRASMAGVTEAAFVRGAILRAVTLPDEKFKEFINEFVIDPDLTSLKEHFEQELKIQSLCYKAVQILGDIAADRGLKKHGEGLEEVAEFFSDIARDFRNKKFCDKYGQEFDSKFMK
jgi:hypothetical protein